MTTQKTTVFTLLSPKKIALLTAFVGLSAAAFSHPAYADDSAIMKKLDALADLVQQQQGKLKNLESKLVDRDKKIDELETKLAKKESASETSSPSPTTAVVAEESQKYSKHKKRATVASTETSPQPHGMEQVGAAPNESDKPPEVSLLADAGGVLTPYGTVVIEPFLDYSRSSVNEFSFNGISPVVGFLIGDITASRTARDLLTGGSTFRVGVTNRLELEAKIPFVWRQDSFTNAVPSTAGLTTTETANGMGLGDIEIAGHYQLNNGQNDWPYFVANLRLKTDTGTSPYDQPFRADGTSSRLATGSGFWAVEPSVTAIYPLDPAVLFGNLGYVHSFDEDINKNIAGNIIGNVAPGDTFIASAGMGVSLNDRLSFMLGYEQDYVRPTTTVVGGSSVRSETLVLGSALTGFSLKVNDRVHVNLNVAAGVTRDAPDTEVTLRVPIALQAFGHSSGQ